MTPGPIIELHRVSKRFGGVRALSDVDLLIEPGTIHGLVGENGAGKSTLGRLIAGVISPDEGTVRVRGREVSYRNPREALAEGITMIAQELSLVPALSVCQNVFLGIEGTRGGVLNDRALAGRFKELCAWTGLSVPAHVPVRSLGFGDQQKVELLRALARSANVIVMDEPTAALTSDEAARLSSIVRRLADSGTTIIYVSHFLNEVLGLAHWVTVLKDGRVVRTRRAAEETASSLVEAMVGGKLAPLEPAGATGPAGPESGSGSHAPVVLEVEKLRRKGTPHFVSFTLRRGEILALAGLVGSGRTELARAVFGADPIESGTVTIAGSKLRSHNPRAAIQAGLAFLPESRKEQGLILRRPVTENVTLPDIRQASRFGVISPARERKVVSELTERVNVRGGRITRPVNALSGGNQQKVLLAKCLIRRPAALIADEPTRGVDVGAKRAIHELLTRLAGEGVAILLISSEIEEILALAHRALVLRKGALVAELEGDDLREESIMAAAFGTAAAARAAS